MNSTLARRETQPIELVERRDPAAERLDVLDDALVVFAGFVVNRLGRSERQVGLQIAKRR